MVTSITFTGEKGYIGERYGENDKPAKPNKKDWKYGRGFGIKRSVDEEKFNADMEQYKEEMKAYRKVKGKYKVPCSENLVGRKFTFESNKINIIFGPNASGKTTIIKSIAAHAFCDDGFSSFIEPTDFRLGLGKYSIESFRKGLDDIIFNKCKTSNVVEWDGSPIYYHNFDNRKNYGMLGDLTGSILSDLCDEVSYIMGKNQRSSGQTMFFQFHKLAQLMSKTITYDDILAPMRERLKHANDYWTNAYAAQEDYYKEFPMAFDNNGQNTYLFDEIDKSMDILNVHTLYTEVLPALSEKYNKQIIIISHSPIVLKDEIYKSDKYNFISMDDGYTEKCREIFSKK